jgi:hypothetical protein
LSETKKRLLPLVENPASLEEALSSAEESQVEQLKMNLVQFFPTMHKAVTCRPIFKGCGYIGSSEGDVIAGPCLFEVKTVDRPLRSVDIRQLVTYCALNHASRQFELNSVGVFNPRRGVWFALSLDIVCREISGQSTQALLDSIVNSISSGDISR